MPAFPLSIDTGVLTVIHVIHTPKRIVWVVDDERASQAIAILSRIV